MKSAFVMAAVVVLAGGCTGHAHPNSETSPQPALAAAVAKTRAVNATFAFNIFVRGKAQLSGQGFHDEEHHVTLAHADDASGGWETFALGTDLYVRLPPSTVGLEPHKYTHIDGSRVKSFTPLGVDPNDPSGIGRFAAAVVSAARGSDGGYSGTVDLARATPPGVTPDVLRQLGSAAGITPFEATVDGAGRLTSLTMHLSGPNFGARDQTYLSFDNVGAKLDEPFTPPSHELVVEASPQLYTLLSG